MPEVELSIRWADGHVQHGVSPSRAIERWLVERAVYPRDELAARVRRGLGEASDRVRERYGYACTAAAELTETLLRGAELHGGAPDAPATVQRLRRRTTAPAAPRPTSRLPSHVDVAIVGAGQAGLCASWYLRRRGVEHVLLERDRIAGSWRDGRWDTFCLVTPNWQCRLPEHPYAGPDPDGFMGRDDIVRYVESFAASFDPPVHEGVEVTRVARRGRSGFSVSTTEGDVHAHQVVLCVSGYHRPRRPAIADALPRELTQLHSSQYRNPSSMPDGAVLVVGTGQSGAQIAEDLHLGGRDVHLAVGSAPRVSRRYRGRDCIAWLEDIGHYDMPVEDHPKGVRAARHEPNHYMTGRDGGHDIDLRAFAADGMSLHGRLRDARHGVLSFEGDLRDNLDGADATADRIKDTIDEWISREGITAPEEARYRAVWQPPGDGSAPLDLRAAGVRSVVWATGFVSDWSWVTVPSFQRDGEPRHTRGICDATGLYVLGLPWLYTWGSGRLAGIARDAEHVADRVAALARVPTAL